MKYAIWPRVLFKKVIMEGLLSVKQWIITNYNHSSLEMVDNHLILDELCMFKLLKINIISQYNLITDMCRIHLFLIVIFRTVTKMMYNVRHVFLRQIELLQQVAISIQCRHRRHSSINTNSKWPLLNIVIKFWHTEIFKKELSALIN